MIGTPSTQSARSVEWSELSYYLLRWSDAWNEPTLSHVNKKWNLNDDYARLHEVWLRPHRRLALMGLRKTATRLLGDRVGDSLVDAMERAVARRAMRGRPRSRVADADQHAPFVPPRTL